MLVWNLHRYQLGTSNKKYKKEAENIFKKLILISLKVILLLPAKVTTNCPTILPKNILSAYFSNTETSSGDDLPSLVCKAEFIVCFNDYHVLPWSNTFLNLVLKNQHVLNSCFMVKPVGLLGQPFTKNLFSNSVSPNFILNKLSPLTLTVSKTFYTLKPAMQIDTNWIR